MAATASSRQLLDKAVRAVLRLDVSGNKAAQALKITKPPLDLYLRCLEAMQLKGLPETDIRRILEVATKEYGAFSTEIWLWAVSWHLKATNASSMKGVEKVTWRAEKELASPELRAEFTRACRNLLSDTRK
mmetsp:Transcript_33648/g.47065  ORF Transcript_33648/g.47065 Transcript_33648/m.47065 type:complete len:131 (+) Transcript_33648:2-394(+)